MTQSNKEKIYLLKTTIEFLYCKEGRSKSYIAKLLDVDRSGLTKIINNEWKLEQANIRYMLPSNQKFLNKHRNLIKSRLDKDIQLKDIAKELGVSIDYVTKTIIKQDEVLLKALEDNNNRFELSKSLVKNYSTHANVIELESEIWKQILGYENYEVSNYGRVKSYDKQLNTYVLVEPFTNKNNGRLYINIKGKSLQVSRLVGFAFVAGYTECNNTIVHIDNDVKNNFYTNLNWAYEKKKVLTDMSNKASSESNKKKPKRIILDGKYEFKTVGAFANFIGKTDKQAEQYIYGKEKNNPYEIELIY